MIKLGLIGDNIKSSRAPKLHKLCGEMCGLDLSYDLLIPREQGLEFDALFVHCRDKGYNGLNITLPYKVKVVDKLVISDDRIRQLGAVNTVLFEREIARGYNTDYTGFIAAWQNAFGNRLPGRVALAGAGGAGRAVAFALMTLGACDVTIYDINHATAQRLAQDLNAVGDKNCTVKAVGSIDEAVEVADGLANCSALGMEGYDGTAFLPHLIEGKTWAFDAVYQPLNTQFLQNARAAGLDVLDGYELHFYQGIQAFQHFTGATPFDLKLLRKQHLAG